MGKKIFHRNLNCSAFPRIPSQTSEGQKPQNYTNGKKRKIEKRAGLIFSSGPVLASGYHTCPDRRLGFRSHVYATSVTHCEHQENIPVSWDHAPGSLWQTSTVAGPATPALSFFSYSRRHAKLPCTARRAAQRATKTESSWRHLCLHWTSNARRVRRWSCSSARHGGSRRKAAIGGLSPLDFGLG